MGTSTCIPINKKWREPALLWFVLASRKGTNKSGALNLLSGALQEIEEMLAEKADGDTDNEEDRQRQLLIDHFWFVELFFEQMKFCILKNNYVLYVFCSQIKESD